MNLSVNLLSETERRSGSPISPVFMIRVASIALPSLIVLGIAALFISARNMERDLASREQALERLRPQLDLVARVHKQAKTYKAMMTMIAEWQSTGIAWHEQLQFIRESVPPSIQLTRLRLDDFTQMVDGSPARAYSIHLQGKTGGARAEDNVQALRQALITSEPLAPFLESVEIPPGTFVQDPAPGALKTDRLFEMRCVYRPRKAQ